MVRAHVWVTVWLSLAVLAAAAVPAYRQQPPAACPAMAATAMAVHVQQVAGYAETCNDSCTEAGDS